MKVEGQITCTTSLEFFYLYKKIGVKLQNAGYTIVNKDKGIITVENSVWRFGSTSELFRKFDKGKFELICEGGETTLKLSYSISILLDIIVVAILISLGLTQEYLLLICAAGFIIQIFVRIGQIKINVQKLIQDILGND